MNGVNSWQTANSPRSTYRECECDDFQEIRVVHSSKLAALWLFCHRDRLPEQRQAINEKGEADRGHHQELGPDGVDAAAAIDDLLRKADKMPAKAGKSSCTAAILVDFQTGVDLTLPRNDGHL